MNITRSLAAHKSDLSVFTVWLFVLSALIGIALGYVSWFIPKTPLNLALGAALLIINFPTANIKFWFVWIFAFLTGMIVEILGVETGVIFGEYYYGDNLGAKFMGVPYLIGVYWAVLAFICAFIGKRLINSNLGGALLGAVLMVGLDFFMEQRASAFDFWHFKGNIVPIQNYITWYVVGFGLQYLVLTQVKVGDFRYSLHLYLSQLVFFIGCLLLLE
ncbi:MAG: carotenoid biosynthesis protein [Saprospiraceae bacterium]